MKEQGHYWKQINEVKESVELNFNFDTFIQTLQIIATHGFKNLKSDLSTRMLNLFNHIHRNMTSNENFNELIETSNLVVKEANIDLKKSRNIWNESYDNSKRIAKNGSEICLVSNRSGISMKNYHEK